MATVPGQTESDTVVELSGALIARRSVTPDDAGCQDLIARRLKAAGMTVESLDVEDVCNLFARHGQGSPHLMLLGHTDVVPPGPEADWSSPPFAPPLRDGKLYGRGAADMKSSVAAFVVALEHWLAACPDHPGTISLLLTSDEEGSARHGVRAVVPWLERHQLLPDACLVGEPSGRDRLGDVIRIGRRGSIQASLKVFGSQGHTAYAAPQDNPVHRAAPLLAALARLEFDDGDEHFPPTRLQVSNLQAGTGADNVTPGELIVMFNLRNNPNTGADELEQRLRRLIGDLDPGPYELDWRISGEPFGPATGLLPGVVQAACRSVLGHAPAADTGGGTSDGRFLGSLGIPVVELGPVNRSIHQVDEHIALDDLRRLPGLYRAVINGFLNAAAQPCASS